jgi:hypothetical protein
MPDNWAESLFIKENVRSVLNESADKNVILLDKKYFNHKKGKFFFRMILSASYLELMNLVFFCRSRANHEILHFRRHKMRCYIF